MQKNIEKYTFDAKNAAERLVRCVDQEDKEINRLSQTNTQLQELTTSLKNTAQGISSAIEENRQSLAEKLHNLEQTILPFKEATIKQETTLSQFGDDFARLQISLGNIQTHLGSTIENLDKLPVKITTIISEINTKLNRNNDELINQIDKSFSDRLELINDKIAENHQHIQSFHREIHEENLQFQKNQGIAIIESFNELKSSTFSEIITQINRNHDVSIAFIKAIDQSVSDTKELVNQIDKSFSDRLKLINDKIAENHQHIQSFHREIHEENLQFQKNQGIAIIESFNELQFRSIKISKWNTILAVVNLLVLAGYLTFILMNY